MIPVVSKRRARARRVAEWAALAVCVLLAAAWVVSLRWAGGLRESSVVASRTIFVSRGVACSISYAGAIAGLPPPGWFRYRLGAMGEDVPPVEWWPRWSRDERLTLLSLPLWIPFLALALPTAWLFWSDRRRARPGHCACGYDLTGLAPDAPCPECGTAAQRRHKTSRGREPPDTGPSPSSSSRSPERAAQ
jgi:hypothetical protein